MENLRAHLLRLCHRLGSPHILFWTLPCLMVLLIAGTLAQKYIGLYSAIHLYFDSWVIWLGVIPLPGFYPLMLVFAVNLFFRFLFKSPWQWNKVGLHLTHFGALLLLIGGLTTTLTAKEGFLVIPEGTAQRYISDYHQRVLAFFHEDGRTQAIPFENLMRGKTQDIAGLEIQVLDRCQSCKISKREENDGDEYKGMAQFMVLSPQTPYKDDEKNLSGVTFAISASQAAGTYIAIEGMPQPISIQNKDGETIQILLGKAQSSLPFSIELQDFVRILHPGTNTAKAYYSDVRILDGDQKWDVRIDMNKPLRYKGYSFYQSSFDIDARGNETTVLAVVENKGQIFPYLSSLIIALGLLLHLYIRYRQKAKAS